MDDTKKAVDALQALAAGNEHRTKVARLRDLLPQIEAAQAAGVTHEKILETLNQQGLDLKMKAYSVMLWRLRKRQGKEKPALPVPIVAMPVIAIKNNESGIKPPSPIAQKKPSDPDKFDWDSEKNETPEW
jgi:hypothetical protein